MAEMPPRLLNVHLAADVAELFSELALQRLAAYQHSRPLDPLERTVLDYALWMSKEAKAELQRVRNARQLAKRESAAVAMELVELGLKPPPTGATNDRQQTDQAK